MGSKGVQLISADMKFNDELRTYMAQEGLTAKNSKYHVVSIIGGQSSGKSTLLNAMFGTSFDMMDPSKGRQQTTKGIWCCKSSGSNVLVMDVEGTDGREKEDQKAFEGKSALFSLALTDVMLINMWMHEVGRFNAANLPLLKTVFEVHLKLLHGNSTTTLRSRPLLLFILRDCDGRTPVENLKQTIVTDLDKIWKDMNKPDHYATSSLQDFFEVQCEGLPHYVYQTDDWKQRVSEVAAKFKGDGGVFKDRGSKDVPADGFSEYAGQLWKTIESDGDLDLPTQRKMLSMVRCENKRKHFTTIAQTRHTEWTAGADESSYRQKVEEGVQTLQAEFREETSGYEEDVREDTARKLEADVWPLLEPGHTNLLRTARERLEGEFAEALEKLMPAEGELPAAGFSSNVKAHVDRIYDDFKRIAEAATPSGAPWREGIYKKDGLADMLHQHLLREAARAKQELAGQVKQACERRLNRELSKVLVPLLDEAPLNMWAEVRRLHKVHVAQATGSMKTLLSDLGMWDDSDESSVQATLRKCADTLVNDKVTDKVAEQSVPTRVFQRFDMLFNRSRGRTWRLWDNPDAEYVKAHNTGLAVLDMFCLSQLYEDDAWPPGQSAVRFIDDARREVLAAEFEAKARQELVWAQVTRANSSTHSSMLVAALVLVLGWNEIMWLFANPLYFILLISAAAGAGVYYFLNRVGDWPQLVALILQTVMSILSPAPPPTYAPAPATPNATPTDKDPLAHAAHLAGPPGREKRPASVPVSRRNTD